MDRYGVTVVAACVVMGDQEREDLESLLSDLGWLRYVDYVRRQIDQELLEWVTRASDQTQDVLALRHLQQLAFYRMRTLQDLAWPRERVAALARQAGEPSPTDQRERDTLRSEGAGRSRRGAL